MGYVRFMGQDDIEARWRALEGRAPAGTPFDLDDAMDWAWSALVEDAGSEAALLAIIDETGRGDGGARELPALPGTPGSALVVTAGRDAAGRKPRHDGWTLTRQTAFVDMLRELGCVELAARAVGMAPSGAYALRKRSRAFREAWEAALRYSALDLERVAMARAMEGAVETAYDAEGNPIGSRRRYNDRLLMFLLRAARPDKYGAANLSSDYGRAVYGERRRMRGGARGAG